MSDCKAERGGKAISVSGSGCSLRCLLWIEGWRSADGGALVWVNFVRPIYFRIVIELGTIYGLIGKMTCFHPLEIMIEGANAKAIENTIAVALKGCANRGCSKKNDWGIMRRSTKRRK